MSNPVIAQIIEAIRSGDEEFYNSDVSLIPTAILTHIKLLISAKKKLMCKNKRKKDQNSAYFDNVHRTTEVLILSTVGRQLPRKSYEDHLYKLVSKAVKLKMLNRVEENRKMYSHMKGVTKASKKLLTLYFRGEKSERNSECKRKATEELIHLDCKRIKRG